MNLVVMANMVSMAGCVLMVVIGFMQKRRSILLSQCVQFAILAAANLMLGAMTGFISGAIGIVRNLVFLKWENTRLLKIVFVVVQLVLSLSVGIHSFIDCFPIISTVLFTWFLDVKSEVRLKLVMIAAQSLWLVYDLVYLNYVTAAFDALTITSNLIGIVMIMRAAKKE